MASVLLSPLPLLLLLLSSSATSSSSSSSSAPSNASSAVEEAVEAASDSFTDFIYSFSDAFLVALGSSDRPENLNLTDLLRVANADGDVLSHVQDHWKDVLLAKIGFVVSVLVGLLFIILMPWIGACFCCCRCCCGNCGGGRRSGKKHNGAEKSCCFLFLFLFAIVLTLFVMGSFIVARQINANAKSILTAEPEDNVVVKAVSAVYPAAESLKDGVEGDLESALKELVDKIGGEFRDAGVDLRKSVNETFAKENLKGKLKEASDLLVTLFEAGKEVGLVLDNSEALKTNSSLQTAVKGLFQTLDNCDPTIKVKCDELKKKVEPLNADEALAQMPMDDLKEVVRLVDDVKGKDLNTKLEEGEKMIASVDGQIAAEVEKYQSKIANVTKDMQGQIKEEIDQYWEVAKPQIKSIEGVVVNGLQNATKKMDDAARLLAEDKKAVDLIDYTTYALYGLSAAAGISVLCLLTAFLAGCCSPKTSADCFMAFTGFYFIFCPLLMLFTMLFYNVLGQLHVEVCDPLLHPDPAKNVWVKKVIDEMPQFRDTIPFDVTEVLYQCSKGEPIYKIVRSTGLADETLDNILKEIDVDSTIADVNSTIADARKLIEDTVKSTVDSIGVDDVAAPIIDALDKGDFDGVFTNASAAINVTAVKERLAGVNLTQVAASLRSAAAEAEAASQTQTAKELRESADEFEKLQREGSVEKEAFPLLDHIERAVDGLMGKNNLASNARSLITGLKSSIATILSDVLSAVSTTISDFSFAALNVVRTGIRSFVDRLSVDIAPCSPVWRVIEDAVSVPCRLLVDPFNGYWFEIGGFLGVGVVALILAVKTVGILRDGIQLEKEEEEDRHIFHNDRNNHVTDHQLVNKNKVGHHNNNGGGGGSGSGGGGGGGGGNNNAGMRGRGARDESNIAIEMQQRNSYAQPPPYAHDEGTYRSTDNICRDYGKPYSYEGRVNDGYRF